MTQATMSIAINRPLDDVFQFVAHAEGAAAWQADIKDVQCTSVVPFGLGATYTEQRTELHQKIDVAVEVTEYEVNRKVSFTRTTDQPASSETYVFSVVGGRTKVTVVFERPVQGRTHRVVEARKAMALGILKTLLEAATPRAAVASMAWMTLGRHVRAAED